MSSQGPKKGILKKPKKAAIIGTKVVSAPTSAKKMLDKEKLLEQIKKANLSKKSLFSSPPRVPVKEKDILPRRRSASPPRPKEVGKRKKPVLRLSDEPVTLSSLLKQLSQSKTTPPRISPSKVAVMKANLAPAPVPALPRRRSGSPPRPKEVGKRKKPVLRLSDEPETLSSLLGKDTKKSSSKKKVMREDLTKYK